MVDTLNQKAKSSIMHFSLRGVFSSTQLKLLEASDLHINYDTDILSFLLNSCFMIYFRFIFLFSFNPRGRS